MPRRKFSEARASALQQNKRVLLVFGANWCMDCHVLDRAFHQPRVAPLLEDNFIVVHVDVGQYDRNLALAKQYHVDPGKGVPSVAVIDGRNALLTSSSEFEKARLLTEQDVVDFLNLWKPKRSSAGLESACAGRQHLLNLGHKGARPFLFWNHLVRTDRERAEAGCLPPEA